MSPSENLPPSEFNTPLLPTLGPHCRTSGGGRNGRSYCRNWEADPSIQGVLFLTSRPIFAPSLVWTGTALRWTTTATSSTIPTLGLWWVDHSPASLVLSFPFWSVFPSVGQPFGQFASQCQSTCLEVQGWKQCLTTEKSAVTYCPLFTLPFDWPQWCTKSHSIAHSLNIL